MTRKRKAEDTAEKDSDHPTSSGCIQDNKSKVKKVSHEAPIRVCEADDNKESGGNERPRTPSSQVLQYNENTPGRLGPIKKGCDCKPDIAPFRGERGHKVRKTASEKEQEYITFVKKHPGHPFHELHVCYDKGPNGSPTYDKSGFELSYDRVAEWMKPLSRRKLKSKKYEDYLDRKADEGKRKKVIFFGSEGAPSDSELGVFWEQQATDRVSKDLQIPYHKVGIAAFEEWERRGFPKVAWKTLPGPTSAEKERLMRLMSGSSLRK